MRGQRAPKNLFREEFPEDFDGDFDFCGRVNCYFWKGLGILEIFTVPQKGGRQKKIGHFFFGFAHLLVTIFVTF